MELLYMELLYIENYYGDYYKYEKCYWLYIGKWWIYYYRI